MPVHGRDFDFDIGQSGGEEPVRVERLDTRIENLHDQLDVVRVEEPEVAAVTGQRHRRGRGHVDPSA